MKDKNRLIIVVYSPITLLFFVSVSVLLSQNKDIEEIPNKGTNSNNVNNIFYDLF